MNKLIRDKCVPCEGGTPPMTPERIAELLPQVPEWKVVDNHHIVREWRFPNFAQALERVQGIGELAEEEGHHPDIRFGWGYLEVTLCTHAIKGLSRNDFIMAAKIDRLPGRSLDALADIDLPEIELEGEEEKKDDAEKSSTIKSITLGIGGLAIGVAIGAGAASPSVPAVCAQSPTPSVQQSVALTPLPTPRPTPPSTPSPTPDAGTLPGAPASR